MLKLIENTFKLVFESGKCANGSARNPKPANTFRNWPTLVFTKPYVSSWVHGVPLATHVTLNTLKICPFIFFCQHLFLFANSHLRKIELKIKIKFETKKVTFLGVWTRELVLFDHWVKSNNESAVCTIICCKKCHSFKF